MQTEGLNAGENDDANAATRGRQVTHTYYDSAGRVSAQLSPWPATGAVTDTPIAASDSPPSHTTYTYDEAGRVTDEILWDGTDSNPEHEKWRTTTVYDGASTLTLPPLGAVPSDRITDARGRLVQLTEYPRDSDTQATADTAAEVRALPAHTTSYVYSPSGKITSMTDPAGNEWTYQYDWAGRQIEAVDPDSGTTTTTYTILGQVDTRTNGNGDTLRYKYDKLGRTTQLIDQATGAPRATWIYDTAEDTTGTRQLGPLGSATRITSAGDYLTTTNTYDDAYRPLSVTTTLPDDPALLDFADTSHTTEYAYAVDGQIAQTKLPAVTTDAGTTVLGAETVTTRFDSAGIASWMGGGFGWGTYVAQSLTRFDGKPLSMDLGNTYGAVITYDWDTSTNRLHNISLDRERVNGSELNLQYGYDPAGNITSIVDAPTNTTAASGFTEAQCLNYDGLRRLTDAWTTASTSCGPTNQVMQSSVGGPAAYWHEYAYDLIGNRTSLTQHTPAGTTVTENEHGDPAEGQGPHQIVETTTTETGAPTLETGYTWDAAGNQTSRAEDGELSELTWDIEGELASITAGEGDVDNVYDADGNRLVRTDDTGVTVYLPGGQELHGANDGTVTATRWYTFAGTTVAVRTGKGLAGVSSVVTNHQGTPIAHIANTDRASGVTRTYSDPYGNVRGTGPFTIAGRGFLSAPVDASGLVQIGARYYDPASGTFISVDPLLDPTLPAQFNAYVYAGNNPSTWSDPTGLTWQMEADHPNGGYRLDAPAYKVPVKPSSGPTQPRAKPRLPPIEGGVPIEETRAYKQAMEDYARRSQAVDMWIEGIILTIAGVRAAKPGARKPASASAPQSPGAKSSIPRESLEVIDSIRNTGVIVQSGVKGASVPKQFANDGRNGSALLPAVDDLQVPITYREWGTVPRSGNPSPGGERIVTGSDGSIYYSPDHYKTFVRWEP